jgi:hypothetical protein
MKSFSKVAGAVLLAGFFAFSVFAQVDLTGMVKDSATQAGISGAKVKLKIANISTTTNASGAYTLVSSAVRFAGSYTSQLIGAPNFKQNSLYFGVANSGEQVKIDIYNLLGRNVASYMDAKLGRGNYQVNVFGPSVADQLYFVKVRVGSKTTMLKMPLIGRQSSSSGQMIKKISGSSLDNSIGNGLGKTAAALDTLIVAASGYKVTRLGISSYTGANDFVLPWYGHVGSIAYDQGSYSGCQHTAAVIVNDTDLTGATVPVRVKSRADTVGFTLVLKKDPTVTGQYLDSISFSIHKSDSATHTIKVQQAKDAYGDSIYAIYSDAAPVMKDTTMVLWSGNSGEIGPGASMYAGLTTKIAINLTDQDLTDTMAYVTIKAPADTVGILFALKPVPFATGTFHGELGVSTAGSSQALGVIKVFGKDILAGENIDIYYQDITPMQTQKGSICTWRPVIGSILLDSAAYHGTVSKMTVTLYEDDIGADTAVVTVKSKKDPTGFSRKLAHTGAATDRVFSGQVGFSTTASNAATGVIAVQAGDSVSVIYVDTTPDTVVVQQAAWSAQ